MNSPMIKTQAVAHEHFSSGWTLTSPVWQDARGLLYVERTIGRLLLHRWRRGMMYYTIPSSKAGRFVSIRIPAGRREV